MVLIRQSITAQAQREEFRKRLGLRRQGGASVAMMTADAGASGNDKRFPLRLERKPEREREMNRKAIAIVITLLLIIGATVYARDGL